MANPDKVLESLKKLCDRRAALDKQIAEAEKKLLAEVKNAGKVVNKTAAVKKPRGRKPSAPKP